MPSQIPVPTIAPQNLLWPPCMMTLEGHSADVFAVAISTDGQFVVSGSSDKTVKIWDAQTGALQRTLKGHTKDVTAVAISTDGQFVVSGSSDKTVKIWYALEGHSLEVLTAANVGDEGGFAPNIQDNREGLDLVNQAIAQAGYTGKVEIGMDVAASEFYKDRNYDLDFKNPASTPDQHNKSIQIVGDALTVTNPLRIQTAIEKNAVNGLLLKVNRIGTVTESIGAAKLAQSDGWGVMVSHRSEETEDTFIADLVVGLRT
ncbi:hypothetical protein HK100_010906 [Physocladia obscura]|uniref:phosphopyruvate hydratase n=1 Tax=Physocladia obscura TaxID=109957 RepID=A0AAD5T247_9FUNG|nr:hypothetical protein HK100_010906 [Physocladia obscura]